MGLLDAFSTGDPTADLAVIGSLLGGKQGQNVIGPALFQAAQMKQQLQNQERQNRANDLQQLTGAYNLLKQQEFPKALEAMRNGQAYMPNPMLPQMEARIAELSGLGNMSNKFGLPPQQPPAMAPQPLPKSLPASVASQYSPAVRPEFQAQGAMPQSQSQQPDMGGVGGPAGGIPMALWLAQDPTGKSYMAQLAKDNEPKILREGDLVGRRSDGSYSSLYQQPKLPAGVMPQRNAQGQVTSSYTLPGFVQSSSEIEGAQAGAKAAANAPYEIKMVDVGGGRIVPMPVSSLAGKTPPTSGGLPFISPGQPAQAPAKLTVTEPSKQTGGSDPFANIPQIVQPSGFGQTTYDAAMAKQRSDVAGKLFEQYGAGADAAQKRLALNNQALSMLDRADTGTGAALIGDVKKALTTRFGIPEEDFANDPSATAVLQKDLMNAATQRAKQQFGSRMTQSEVMMMLSRGAPNVDMTKNAIRFLLETDNAQANYDIQQASHFGEYVGRGGDPFRFQAWYAKNFPLTKQEEQLQLPKGNVIRYDKNGKRIDG